MTSKDKPGKTRKSDLPPPPPPPVEGEPMTATEQLAVNPVDVNGDELSPPTPVDPTGEPPAESEGREAYEVETIQRGRMALLSWDMQAMGLADGMEANEATEAVAQNILDGGPASYMTPERRAMHLMAQHLNAVHAQMRKLSTALYGMSTRGAGDPEAGVPHGKRSLHGRIDKQKLG